MVFDVKMEDLRRKVHLVMGGHVTQMPDIITYSGMLTKETVCIALTMAA